MVTVCQNCGDRGFSNALIFCHQCQFYAVHLYCLAIIPTNFEEYVVWLCVDCESKATKLSPLDKLGPEWSRTCSLNESKVSGLEKSSSFQLLADNRRTDQEDESQNRLGKCSFGEFVEPLESKKSLLDLDDHQPLEMNCSDDGERDEEHGKQDVLGGDSLYEAADCLETENSPALVALESNNSEGGERDLNLERRNALDGNLRCEEAERLNSSNSNMGSFPEEAESLKTKKTELTGQGIYPLEKDCCKDGDKVGGCHHLDEGIFSAEADPRRTEISQLAISYNPNIVEQNYVPAKPIEEPVWRGHLSILDKSLGLIAHVSNLACPKVSEEARSLPASLSPELLPRSTVWPKGFAKWGPSDDSIALYFFPDSERSEKVFDGLVDDMISRDLGMRAIVQHAELLIFSSTLMPMDFWRFQAKFYLWGVFKAKQPPRAAADAIPGEEKGITRVFDRRSPVSPLSNGSSGCGSIYSALSPSVV